VAGTPVVNYYSMAENIVGFNQEQFSAHLSRAAASEQGTEASELLALQAALQAVPHRQKGSVGGKTRTGPGNNPLYKVRCMPIYYYLA